MSPANKQRLAAALFILTTGVPTMTSANDLDLTIVNPPGLYDPAPFGYSHAVIAPAGRTAYIAGQSGMDARGGLSPDFAVQVEQAYANLATALDGVGATPGQVTKLTIFVVDHDQSKLGVLTEAVQKMFGSALPAQTLIPVSRLTLDGMLFEVDAVAALD